MAAKKVLFVELDPAFHRALRLLAAEQGTTLTQVAREAIEQYLSTQPSTLMKRARAQVRAEATAS